ncbi:uncharacterized protein LOC120648942 [Panicum virgatum]|uniref:uncharacterized protein LOC120648942 n=1 Tax=Panicum virgatum TaxID=38727 RepID=UPI0019D566C2|nr:uncharacterized protein LOC120648942 [Panicum virgatum]
MEVRFENCIDKQLSQIGNISLVGDRALRAFLARAPRLADPASRRSEAELAAGASRSKHNLRLRRLLSLSGAQIRRRREVASRHGVASGRRHMWMGHGLQPLLLLEFVPVHTCLQLCSIF